MRLDEFEKRHKAFLKYFNGEHTNFAKTITVLIALVKAAKDSEIADYCWCKEQKYCADDDRPLCPPCRFKQALKDLEKE